MCRTCSCELGEGDCEICIKVMQNDDDDFDADELGLDPEEPYDA